MRLSLLAVVRISTRSGEANGMSRNRLELSSAEIARQQNILKQKFLLNSTMNNKSVYILVSFLLLAAFVRSKKSGRENKPEWAKKDIRDYSEADLERLLDQWEVRNSSNLKARQFHQIFLKEDEEPLEDDELPEHLRPQPQIDMSKIDMSNPEDLLQKTKKGRTVMTFVTVSGNPTKEEAEEITKLWQTSLWNNHIQAERYMIDDNRAIFMFKDGAQSWEAKDFLVDQERCESVSVENKVYNGKFSGKKDEL